MEQTGFELDLDVLLEAEGCMAASLPCRQRLQGNRDGTSGGRGGHSGVLPSQSSSSLTWKLLMSPSMAACSEQHGWQHSARFRALFAYGSCAF